ncbi:MAG TPA: DUF4159 domain-containing protein, partial [Planctomycetota bacterium]|nr:DUF4159 domain-containing protein [Planctomycetota bacterium]
PEGRTYSVGLIQMLLFENGGSRHARLVDVYGWMTVVSQQRAGDGEGQWGYSLLVPTPQTTPSTVPPLAPGYADHSNGQLGILALWYAQRSGYQVPKKVWQRAKEHYERTQLPDGGWTYAVTAGRESTVSMTPASTVSLYLCDEALAGYEKTHQCRMTPENPAVERGMTWVGEHKITWPAPYTWYAIERLGILTGRSEFGGRNWMEEGAGQLVKTDWTREGRDPKVDTAFAVLFLARALEPVIINKLKHKGDWNNDRYDVKKLTEYIGEKFQYPKQWRIVTLEASVDELLKVPILYVNGHEALEFTDAEKTKLREYVNRGGTLFGMACCGRKPFDESFRALVAELWPDDKLKPLPKTHTIFDNPRPLVTKPLLLGLELGAHNGRLGVIYSPYDMCCRWDRGGEAAKGVYDVGANIYYYVTKEGVKLGGVREGYAGHTAGADEVPAPR